MTIAPGPEQTQTDLVTVVVDDISVRVPKGTLVIRVAEQMGVEIPRFCDHPLLDAVAACRMCLIEIDGNPKPQPACAITVTDGMKVKTQRTSPVAEKAQEGVMEFLLLNHPLDCPICDKGGECPLQNQAMTAGRGESRFEGKKRTFPKPINISAQILLDRERCVSCARCTRFADQIAGDPMLELLERGAQQQVGVADDAPFDSYFSGNTIQICPVGALTSSLYRFRSRPFDLVSTPTTCEHCASGCSLRTDVRRGEITRRLAWDDPEVNEEWNCDKGRFAFKYTHDGRVKTPLIREDGELRPASWPEALDAAARGLAAAGDRVGVLTGGRLTREDAYSYAKFARIVLGTDDIDFRSRPASDEEAQFLAAAVAGRLLGPTYADLDAADNVVMVGLEPEDESPIIMLRLRRAARKAGTRVWGVSPVNTRGLAKVDGTWVPCRAGDEAALLRSALQSGDSPADGSAEAAAVQITRALSTPGAVLLIGERLASVPGALSAAWALAERTGARVGWVPRRAGERGALDAGALAGLLPGGRPLTDPTARAEVARVWGVEPDQLPRYAGRAGSGAIVESASALVLAGIEPDDDPDRSAILAALGSETFVVSIETHHSAVTELADVILPVAVDAERAGSYTDWEGRVRPFGAAITGVSTVTDSRVLAMLADTMDRSIGRGDIGELRSELAALGNWTGSRAAAPDAIPETRVSDGLRLASWRLLLDLGRLQDGEPHLAATARATEALMSPATAAAYGLTDGALVTVTAVGTGSRPRGSVCVALRLDDVAHDTVWLPMNSPGCSVLVDLQSVPGESVLISLEASA